MSKNRKPIIKNFPMILVILDGWGIDKPNRGNAVALARTPTFDGLMRKFPSTQLRAHGKFAGLPSHQVGNSEAGHMNIGAGRLVEQDAVKITRSIDDGTFYKNSAFLGAIRHVRKMNSKFHIIGMLSNGQSPHSDPGHLNALLRLLKKNHIKNVFLHLFTDGRDSPKYASLKLFEQIDKNLYNFKIVTIMGRFYAMDRKKKWDRTQKAYQALVYGQGRKSLDVYTAVTEAYNRGDSDEFIEPCVIDNMTTVDSRIADGDSVVFFNLRSDRGRQLTKAFVQTDFEKMNPGSFNRRRKLEHLYFSVMTDFGPDLDDVLTAFPSVDLDETLPMQFRDYRQLYLAETEKYAHVTYFLNGGYSGRVAGEDQLMIPSPDVKSYDETPEMSSRGLTRVVLDNVKKINKRQVWDHDLIVMNFAAPDMVGHTGNLKAGIACCERVDYYLNKITEAYLAVDGTVVITADHGNIERMINLESGEIFTEHTTNPVPFIIVNKKMRNKTKLKKQGILGDIAPTLLNIAGLEKPGLMTRRSLF